MNSSQFIRTLEYVVMVNKSRIYYPELNVIERGQMISSMGEHDRKEYNKLKKEGGIK